jgi:hypothetical protein
MPELDPRAAALLESHERNHRWILLAGALLALGGSGYAGWGALRFDPRGSIESHASFDRPLTALTRIYDPYKRVLRQIKPLSDTEQLLLGGMRRNMSFTAGALITLLRVFMGVLALLSGLFLIAVAFERQRLVRIVQHLRS